MKSIFFVISSLTSCNGVQEHNPCSIRVKRFERCNAAAKVHNPVLYSVLLNNSTALKSIIKIFEYGVEIGCFICTEINVALKNEKYDVNVAITKK